MTRHVVLGAGPVGRETARALLRRGAEVTMVSRSGASVDGAQGCAVDVLDTGSLERVVPRADVVYQALNPAYTRWRQDFPALQRAALALARRRAARLVVMDNVYALGRPDDRVFDETTEPRPCSRKGRVRREMADDLWAAHGREEVQVTSGHASDYFGPGSGEASPIGDAVFSAAATGGVATLLGGVDTRHSYTYLPEIGEGLAALGTREASVGRRWHLPTVADPWTTRQMVARAFELAGHRLRIRRVPSLAVRLAGLADPTAREVAEMAYEFEEPFVVASDRIRALGVTPTPLDDAIARTLAAHRPPGAGQSHAPPRPGATSRRRGARPDRR